MGLLEKIGLFILRLTALAHSLLHSPVCGIFRVLMRHYMRLLAVRRRIYLGKDRILCAAMKQA
jgi:hypothetical protein